LSGTFGGIGSVASCTNIEFAKHAIEDMCHVTLNVTVLPPPTLAQHLSPSLKVDSHTSPPIIGGINESIPQMTKTHGTNG
jgi:hypothetical protein